MGLKEVIAELERVLKRELNLDVERYYLQTPTALVTLYVDENDDGERTLHFEVSSGESAVFVETENDIFKDLFIKGDN